ncbi:hypothetical protein TrLO_g9406 [Triparma laevis f. longispina]|uniref:Uncharacterized protein n=1 Tax=Triparma laevis f. longispina TaxID=1714387 RepID=A0A9W7AE53_9STRA|nr:hypothetical protein TrLO_g9406 [Triparma laevis f. longispina]
MSSTTVPVDDPPTPPSNTPVDPPLPPSSSTSNPSTPSPPPSSSPPPPVTSLSPLYSLNLFLLTSLHPLIYSYSFFNPSPKIWFWTWTIKPSCVTAMALSFGISPRSSSRIYLFFLNLQYFLLTFGSDIIMYCLSSWNDWNEYSILFLTLRSISYVLAWCFGIYMCSKTSKLRDSKLSQFLVKGIFKQGMLIGLGQLIFLGCAPLQCDFKTSSENLPWTECRRALYSQTGLGAMVSLYIIINIVSGMAPSRILIKHYITPKMILKGNLKKYQIGETVGMAVSGLNALSLVSLYGAEGDFHDEVEEVMINGVMVIGIFTMLINAGVKFVKIRKEIKVTFERDEQTKEDATKEEETTVNRTSWFWVFCGSCSVFYQCVVNYLALEGNLFMENLSSVGLPTVVIVFIGSFFSQPKRTDRAYLVFLFANFILFVGFGETMHFIMRVEAGEYVWALTHVIRVGIWCVVFYLGLKLRHSIGTNLNEADLEHFLVNTLFVGGVQTIASVFFLTFRAARCSIEFNLKMCGNAAICSSYISSYLVIWWLVN